MSVATIAIVTLGCAKNEVDSSRMKRKLRTAGFSLVGEDQVDDADVVILNTCGFIQPAIEESLDSIFSITDMDRYQTGELQLIVAGCLSSRFGADLEEELTEVQHFVPCSREDSIVDVVMGIIPEELRPEPSTSPYCGFLDMAGENDYCAYVKISDGCNRHCSFCTIPMIRGNHHSFPYEDIRGEVELCVSQGVKEITLIAQDTSRYGTDFKDQKSSLAELLCKLADEFTSTWFRVMYIEPEGVTDELLDVMRTHDNVCKYLDIPLQHVDQTVLKAMNRIGNLEYFIQKIEHIREVIPEITLRTTLISGFPGETEEAHEMLLDFLSEVCFDYVGVFPYSPEDGTKAAELDDQIDEEVKIARAQEVRDVADAVSSTIVASRIGREIPVLVLGAEDDGQLFGRSMAQAPEVDGVTFVDEGVIGEIGTYQIIDTMFYEMEAEKR